MGEVGFFAVATSWQSQLSGGFHASGLLLTLSFVDGLVMFRFGERALLLATALGGFKLNGSCGASWSNETWWLLLLVSSSFLGGDKGLPGVLTAMNHFSIKADVDTSLLVEVGDDGAE